MPKPIPNWTDEPFAYGSAKKALIGGMRTTLGIPLIALGASYLGFGSLVRDSGLPIWYGVYSTFFVWALPGQIAMIELYGAGAALLVVAVTVSLVNARFLPMTVTVMPLIRKPGVAPWRYYLAAHLLSINSWAYLMQRGPLMPRDERWPYYLGFALTLWSTGMLSAALGFLLAGAVPRPVSLGLVFLNPVYFMLLVLVGIRKPTVALATGLGVLLGPLLHLATPEWGLLLTGVIAGSLGFFGGRWWERRHG